MKPNEQLKYKYDKANEEDPNINDLSFASEKDAKSDPLSVVGPGILMYHN